MNQRLRELAGDIPGLAGPHLNDRQIKALMIVVGGGIPDLRIHGNVRLVPSQHCDGAFYLTTPDSCTCGDDVFRPDVCKHRLAVRVQATLDAARVESDTLPF